MNIQPIILCGGSGTRLWPLSRQNHPKQLLSLFGSQTMLQETTQRILDFQETTAQAIIAVTAQEYRFAVAEQLRQTGCNYQLLLEPCPRGTAAALAAAAACVDRETILLVMPADHLIQDHTAFTQAVQTAYTHAQNNTIICFGITPTHAHTGYGYIKTSPNDNDTNTYQLNRFIEKPDATTAQQLLNSGSHFWNSGIFMLKAGLWLDLLHQFNPAIAQASQNAIKQAEQDRDFLWLDAHAFAQSPNDSIDYAVMEHIGTEKNNQYPALVVPLNAAWSDIGAWDAVWEKSDKDQNGNAISGSGSIITHQAHNNLIHSAAQRTVTLLGTDNIIAIDTHDAILIATRDKLPEMRQLIEKIQQQQPELLQSGQTVYRPWGHYQLIDKGTGFQVKRISVKPKHILSLQKHQFRSEHWVVVNGTCRIQRGEESLILQANQSTYIPQGMIHRLENTGEEMLELIEVQSGSYLGEDDIERLEDLYGRIKNLTNK